MTQTMIADDAAAIAQAMKDLGLEKSVPAEPNPAPEFVDGDVRMTEAGWQIHDDDWQGLAFTDEQRARIIQMWTTQNSILEELEWVEARSAAVGMTEPV